MKFLKRIEERIFDAQARRTLRHIIRLQKIAKDFPDLHLEGRDIIGLESSIWRRWKTEAAFTALLISIIGLLITLVLR